MNFSGLLFGLSELSLCLKENVKMCTLGLTPGDSLYQTLTYNSSRTHIFSCLMVIISIDCFVLAILDEIWLLNISTSSSKHDIDPSGWLCTHFLTIAVKVKMKFFH